MLGKEPNFFVIDWFKQHIKKFESERNAIAHIGKFTSSRSMKEKRFTVIAGNYVMLSKYYASAEAKAPLNATCEKCGRCHCDCENKY